jgi:hypothetical protein
VGRLQPRSTYLKMDVAPLLVLRSSVGSSVPWNGDVPDSQAWIVGFRELSISPHEKLLILSHLLEETIAVLNANLIDESASPDQAS